MRDRHRLSKDGFIVALIPINDQQRLVGEPQLVSRGFVDVRGSNELMNAGKEEVRKLYTRGTADVRRALEEFFYRETQLRPVVLPKFIRV